MLGHLDLHNPGSLTIERLNDLKCNNIIELPGHVDNVQEWLAKASVFVLPSGVKGFREVHRRLWPWAALS